MTVFPPVSPSGKWEEEEGAFRRQEHHLNPLRRHQSVERQQTGQRALGNGVCR